MEDGMNTSEGTEDTTVESTETPEVTEGDGAETPVTPAKPEDGVSAADGTEATAQ